MWAKTLAHLGAARIRGQIVMQEILNLARRLVYPAAICLLFWAGWQVLASPYISDSSGKIIAVYNGDSTVQDCTDAEHIAPDKENVSEEALAGFCGAVRALSKPGPQVDLVNIHNEGNDLDPKSTKMYQQLASRVALGPVAGVISFLTSPDSPPLVRFCRTMQIPLLLAVAANDDLMAPAEDTRGLVFRMIPTNGRQAIDMAAWLGQKVHGRPLRMAVFHEPNTFGEFLQRQLNHELGPKTRSKEMVLFNFEVTEQLEFADLMPQLWCENLDMIVYLGFASRAMDLLNKLRWYRADDQVTCPSKDAFKKVTVLLSSGAYNEELNDHDKYAFPFEIYAVLPTLPAAMKAAKATRPNASQDDDETAASEYGYDSYALLENLAAQKFKIPSQPMGTSKTGHDYHFDKDGELVPAEKNHYQAYLLASSPPARKQ
jgi:hypothetical protein